MIIAALLGAKTALFVLGAALLQQHTLGTEANAACVARDQIRCLQFAHSGFPLLLCEIDLLHVLSIEIGDSLRQIVQYWVHLQDWFNEQSTFLDWPLNNPLRQSVLLSQRPCKYMFAAGTHCANGFRSVVHGCGIQLLSRSGDWLAS